MFESPLLRLLRGRWRWLAPASFWWCAQSWDKKLSAQEIAISEIPDYDDIFKDEDDDEEEFDEDEGDEVHNSATSRH